MKINEISQYLNDHPRTYVIISSGFAHLVHADFSCDSYLFDNCKQQLQPYIDKYNINNYKGNIAFSIFENNSFLLYKNEYIFKRHDGCNINIKDSQDLSYAIIWILNELLNSEETMNRISFNLKDKSILNQLSEFYRYIYLDANKTNQWLLSNVRECFHG